MALAAPGWWGARVPTLSGPPARVRQSLVQSASSARISRCSRSRPSSWRNSNSFSRELAPWQSSAGEVEDGHVRPSRTFALWATDANAPRARESSTQLQRNRHRRWRTAVRTIPTGTAVARTAHANSSTSITRFFSSDMNRPPPARARHRPARRRRRRTQSCDEPWGSTAVDSAEERRGADEQRPPCPAGSYIQPRATAGGATACR